MKPKLHRCDARPIYIYENSSFTEFTLFKRYFSRYTFAFTLFFTYFKTIFNISIYNSRALYFIAFTITKWPIFTGHFTIGLLVSTLLSATKHTNKVSKFNLKSVPRR